MIIHVAGIYGSGKSYVAEFFKNIYPDSILKTIDLDDIILPIIYRRSYKNIAPEKRMALMMKRINAIIETNIKKYPNILFSGYDYIYNTKNNIKKLYRCVINADYKYFISGDINKFIVQYRERAIKYIQNSNDGVYITSHKEYKQAYNNDKKIYKDYAALKQEEIMRHIIILVEQCQ